MIDTVTWVGWNLELLFSISQVIKGIEHFKIHLASWEKRFKVLVQDVLSR